jgi:hypothetical protein
MSSASQAAADGGATLKGVLGTATSLATPSATVPAQTDLRELRLRPMPRIRLDLV